MGLYPDLFDFGLLSQYCRYKGGDLIGGIGIDYVHGYQYIFPDFNKQVQYWMKHKPTY